MLAIVAVTVLQAVPTVTNVQASQRADGKLVDIWYDVSNMSGGYAFADVVVEAGGSLVSATTLSGDLVGLTAGSGKHIIWDAGADWNEQFSSSVRVQVTVSDAPSGKVLIPAGSFSMGDNWDSLVDAPVHTVYVSAFYMDQYEVTKTKWDEVATWAATNGYDISSASAAGKASSHPGQKITWYSAVKWCNARSQKEGMTPCYTVSGVTYKSGSSSPICNWAANGYRLPTEAEWEKAARGMLLGKRFPWGDTITHSQANYQASPSSYLYDMNATSGFHPAYTSGSQPYTSPAGMFAANGYGLYDMAGNTWGWCWDWYSDTYYSGSPASNPQGPSSGTYRVLRGGAWDTLAHGCRVAFRYSLAPTSNYNSLGFRPVRRGP